jgi:hypothetical protein
MFYWMVKQFDKIKRFALGMCDEGAEGAGEFERVELSDVSIT